MNGNINVNADLNQGIQTIIDSLEKVGISISKTAKNALDYIYPIAVKQQVLEGWMYIICGSLFLGLGIIFTILTIKAFKNNYDNQKIGFSIFLIISLLIALPMIFCSIPQIINPEYYAILDIINKIQGK